MNVSDLMTSDVKSCAIDDNLQRAAQLMWEDDCGIVPVLAAICEPPAGVRAPIARLTW